MSKTINWYGNKFTRFRLRTDGLLEIDLRIKIVTREIDTEVVNNLDEESKFQYLSSLAQIAICEEMLEVSKNGVNLRHGDLFISVYNDLGDYNIIAPDEYKYVAELMIKIFRCRRPWIFSNEISLLGALLDEIIDFLPLANELAR